MPAARRSRLFGSAEHEIAILAYSALFLAEDTGILRILAEKGRAGVIVRIALGDPDGPNVAERGEEEGIGDAIAAKIRNALTLCRPLSTVENIEIRLHRTVLYNSIYRAGDQLLVNQHTYGIPAARHQWSACAMLTAARWPPSTLTASSVYGLVPRHSHGVADQHTGVGGGDGSEDRCRALARVRICGYVLNFAAVARRASAGQRL